MRSKFKKWISECKRAALTLKTGTGIKRFQVKRYGSWFQKLYEVVKTRDSCQPDQAIEPRAAISNIPTVPSEDTSESEASLANQSKVFVPLKQA